MKPDGKHDDAVGALCHMVTEVWKSGKSQRINLNDYLGFDWKTDRDVWNVCNDPIKAITEAIECMGKVGDEELFGPEILVMKSWDIKKHDFVITLVDVSRLKRLERKLS